MEDGPERDGNICITMIIKYNMIFRKYSNLHV